MSIEKESPFPCPHCTLAGRDGNVVVSGKHVPLYKDPRIAAHAVPASFKIMAYFCNNPYCRSVFSEIPGDPETTEKWLADFKKEIESSKSSSGGKLRRLEENPLPIIHVRPEDTEQFLRNLGKKESK